MSRRACLAFGLNSARGGRRYRESCARLKGPLNRTDCGDVPYSIQGCVLSNSWKEHCANKHCAYCCNRPQFLPSRLLVSIGRLGRSALRLCAPQLFDPPNREQAARALHLILILYKYTVPCNTNSMIQNTCRRVSTVMKLESTMSSPYTYPTYIHVDTYGCLQHQLDDSEYIL